MRWHVLARLGAILTGIFLLFLLIAQAGPAQSGKDKAGASKKDATQPAKETAAPAGDLALSPEIKHRIETELRSHYNVPAQISIALSDPKPGNTPGYDDVVVTLYAVARTPLPMSFWFPGTARPWPILKKSTSPRTSCPKSM